MGTIRDQEKIEELRTRLYARGQPEVKPESRVVTPPPVVATTWQDLSPPPTDIALSTPPMATRRNKNYRWYLFLAGVFFFVVALAISATIFLTGGNVVSGENIGIELNAPIAVGGGEVVPLQVGITNQNSVPINTAVLVLTYPAGIQATTEEGGTLTKERIELDVINAGETVNVPIRVLAFGEENEEKTITASIEYRVEGSNANFYKEATPLTFKISSAPLVLAVESVDKIAAGQEFALTLTVRSNTPSALSDVLVSIEYPNTFSFTRAEPSPVTRQNTWRFNELSPETEATITITGVLNAETTEAPAFRVTVGTASDRNALTMSSVLAAATKAIEIEQPFIGVVLDVGGDTSGDVSLPLGEAADVSVRVENTLPIAIYDMRVEAELGGSAYRGDNVDSERGFFESAADKIVWQAVEEAALRELGAGRSVAVSFEVEPAEGISNPELTFAVNLYGKRIEAANTPEELIGTAEARVRFSDLPTIVSDASRNTSAFSDRGPIPPVAEVDTTYTLAFRVEAGTNDVRDGVVTATLPTYVSWLNQTSGSGVVSFNPVSREVTWQVGTIAADRAVTTSFQVSVTPSLNQVGDTLTIMSEPQFRGTDSFTGGTVRARSDRVTTELSPESGFKERNGQVVRTLQDSAAFNQ